LVDDRALSPLAGIVRKQDHDRFLTALFAPAAQRDSLMALYAFNYEVAKTREMVRESMLGSMRLQWWRDSISAIYEDAPVRRHEVVEPLAATIREHRLSRVHFDRLIDAREADLADAPPATLAALEAYAEASSVPLVLLALEILGVRDRGCAEAARGVGIGFALAGLLSAVPFHARQRRLYLPADLLAAQKIDVERTLFEMKPPPALAGIAAEISARAEACLARARKDAVPRAAIPALLPGIVASRKLARIARAGHDLFAPSLRQVDGMLIARLAVAALMGRY